MIDVHHEPADIPPYWTQEHCCFCSAKTRYWHGPTMVACCPACAKVHTADQVPTKVEWMRRRALRLGIPVAQEPSFAPVDPKERCCLCRAPTIYRCTERDVACCTACAPTNALEQVPTKQQWLANERSLARCPWDPVSPNQAR